MNALSLCCGLLMIAACFGGCAAPYPDARHQTEGAGAVAWLAKDQARAVAGAFDADYWQRWGRKLEPTVPPHIYLIEQPVEAGHNIQRAFTR